MNIKAALLEEHSKRLTFKIGEYIGEDPKRFSEIVQLVVSGEEVVSQRAAWVLGTHGEQFPKLILPHLNKLLPLLGKDVHHAVKRNILRVLQYTSVPEKVESKLVSHCFNLLLDSSEPIAVKAFSITVIVNLSEKYPDLLQELKAWFDNNQSVASKAEVKRMEKAGLFKK